MKRVVVVKVGGSLLDWAGLPARLRAFFDARPDESPVLVVGGGRIVEAIRELDRAQALGEEVSHALAISAMGLTAEILARIVPGLERVDELGAIADCLAGGRIPVLAPGRFLADEDEEPDPLPHLWSVTSDSIAARLADRIGASALILLKSAPLPGPIDRAEASRLGLVDPEFPRASARVATVLYADLRSGETGGRAID